MLVDYCMACRARVGKGPDLPGNIGVYKKIYE